MNEEEFYNKVYDVLTNLGGASESDRPSFIHNHLKERDYPCDEWRFCGHFGFGGKYRRSRNTIDYYRENHTEKLDILQGIVNQELARINKYGEYGTFDSPFEKEFGK